MAGSLDRSRSMARSIRPDGWVRVGVVAAVVIVSAAVLVVPTNLSAVPLAFRVTTLAVGWAMVASGLIVWSRRPGNAIGPTLIVAGVLWLVGRLQGAEPLPLAIVANLSNTASQVMLLGVLLAFPTGRVGSRVGWLILGLAAILATGSNLLQATTSPVRPGPGTQPPNPLYIPIDPGLLAPLQVAFAAGTLMLVGASIIFFAIRWRHATPPARRSYRPLFLAGLVIGPTIAILEPIIRSGRLPVEVAQLLVLVQVLTIALLPAAVMIGVLQLRMARGAVADLVVELGDTPEPERLREALAGALGDPSLEVVYWSPPFRTFLDRNGVPTDPADATDQAVTYLERDGRPIAAILHDPALAEDPGLVAAVGSAVRLAVENDRLTEEVRSQLAEVQASRTRIVEAADAERRRVERNLHDGAQQRLVALSLALKRARSQLPEDADDDVAATLDDASTQLTTALAELRELARGIHPAVLTEAGLAAALRGLARDAPVRVEARIAIPDRLSPTIEATAYFVVAEAMANVAKYADASTINLIAEADDGMLRVEVADDGKGGADASAGSGLRGLADRVAAVGGRLDVRSMPGEGTRVVARLPLAARMEQPA